MSELDDAFLSRADLYRKACAPSSSLDGDFVASLRIRIMQDDPEQWDDEIQHQTCTNWCVALRSAISEAWDSYKIAEITLDRLDSGWRTRRPVPPKVGERREWTVNEFMIATAHTSRIAAMKTIRTIAREMYRHAVPHEERIM